MDGSDWSAVFDGVTAIAAIAGVVIGGMGLRSWRKELRGRHEFELLRRFLVDLYKCRSEVAEIRNPMNGAIEMRSESSKSKGTAESDAEQMDHKSLQVESWVNMRNVYQEKWRGLMEARKAVYADLDEAEAMGMALHEDLLRPMEELHFELFVAIQNYVDQVHPRGLKQDHAQMGTTKLILWSMPGKDEWKARYKAAIGQAAAPVRAALEGARFRQFLPTQSSVKGTRVKLF